MLITSLNPTYLWCFSPDPNEGVKFTSRNLWLTTYLWRVDDEMSKGETEIFSSSGDSDHLGRLVAQQSERRRRAHHWGKFNKTILKTWDP